MTKEISRAQFIRGEFHTKGTVPRPPWAVEEDLFTELCDRCGECLRHCPRAIIKTGQGQYPVIDFTRSGCDFCAKCVQACSRHALVVADREDTTPWSITPSFLSNCLSMNGIVCRSCSEVCPERAVRFSLQVGGSALPSLIAEQCSGCGECLAVCPNKSIEFINQQRAPAHTARRGN